MKTSALQWLRYWLPDSADIPDGLRIGLPMVAGLLLFTFLGDTTSGVNALIAAWLVGVQGRNLAYPKRADLLSKSALLCCFSSALALLSLWHHFLGIVILGLLSLIYGLTSNQRKYIQLLAYNAGFCVICSLHLLETGSDWKMVLLSTLFGSAAAVVSAVIAGPWLAIRQGEQLQGVCRQKLTAWCQQLAESALDNVGLRLALREQLDDSIAVLSHWLLEMPNKPQVEEIARRLQAKLTIIDKLETISRIQQQNNHDGMNFQPYFSAVASQLTKGCEPLELTVPTGTSCQNLLQEADACLKQAMAGEIELRADWRDQLSQVWPSDAKSVRTQWRKAIRSHSREWHHGLRIVFTLLCCQAVVMLLHLPQGYWVTLTAYIVLMVAPLGQLQARIWSRMYGTVFGSILALSLIWFMGQGQWLYYATCITVFLAFTTFYKARYEIHVFWLTMMMIFAITLLLPSDPYIAFYRAVDTFTGALIAFLAMHLFIPSWTRRWLDSYVDTWWQLEKAYLDDINQGVSQSPLRWQAHEALRQLNQEISFMRLEPNTTQRELRDWQSLLWHGLTLHASLIIMEHQQHTPADWTMGMMDNWQQLYQERMSAQWSLLENHHTVGPEQWTPQQWLSEDINRLYGWLNWQRPFDLQP
ncbi:hypothetical protein NFHSH190041_32910 [Shewanella sp. NFH-SH190041]|uniref:FUSC family protein n=1 Tax=Shewanella sp. NFH-SH190041 TaxID=2950245 RepID=UPI0021C3C7E9|nr:FUSC family protein [Shewanella sp. NFH-SH190041]BDM65839.1 hypothetical protein NFHSH190041_32910 [Shewanella sp. NFH-SH190041]